MVNYVASIIVLVTIPYRCNNSLLRRGPPKCASRRRRRRCSRRRRDDLGPSPGPGTRDSGCGPCLTPRQLLHRQLSSPKSTAHTWRQTPPAALFSPRSYTAVSAPPHRRQQLCIAHRSRATDSCQQHTAVCCGLPFHPPSPPPASAARIHASYLATNSSCLVVSTAVLQRRRLTSAMAPPSPTTHSWQHTTV